MPFKFTITKDIHLVDLDTQKLLNIVDDLENRCVICRDVISNDNRSKEHIYPRWLQKMFNLENKKLILMNGTTITYKNLVVSCCTTCNGDIMGLNENIIKQAFSSGIDEVRNIDEEFLVWWLLKIYYLQLVKDSTLKSDVKNPISPNIVSEQRIQNLQSVYYYMIELLKGVKFKGKIPYELYIFPSEDIKFDYIDDVESNSVFIQINGIIVICCFDSFSMFKEYYSNELVRLSKLEKVYSFEAIELFVKMSFFRKHFRYDTAITHQLDSDGVKMLNEIVSLSQIKEIELSELHEYLVVNIKRLLPDIQSPGYEENKIITIIRNT